MNANVTEPLIQVQNLTKAFGDHVVLNGITTEIHQGEVVAIIGPSGCGKSTFLRSMNLLEQPTSGRILFEGTDITDKSVDINKMRQKIGMVFQQFNLFPNYTIKDNITLAPTKLGLMNAKEAEQRKSRYGSLYERPSVTAFGRSETENCNRTFPCNESRRHAV